MSFANPYVPPSCDNLELARDMRLLANRLDAQADRFADENVHARLRCLDSSADTFRRLARELRINADEVQPSHEGEGQRARDATQQLAGLVRRRLLTPPLDIQREVLLPDLPRGSIAVCAQATPQSELCGALIGIYPDGTCCGYVQTVTHDPKALWRVSVAGLTDRELSLFEQVCRRYRFPPKAGSVFSPHAFVRSLAQVRAAEHALAEAKEQLAPMLVGLVVPT